MNENIRKLFETTMAKYDISQNTASKDIGYSSPVLSAYRKGTYNGVVAEVEEAIMRWVARVEQDHARKRVPITETDDLKQVVAAINMAHTYHDIALITGDAGSGKTTAARFYREKNPRTTILIDVMSGMNRKMLVQEVAAQLGINYQRMQLNVLASYVGQELKSRDMVVILDEADYLKADALEFTRRFVYDLGDSGLVIIGLPKLRGMIINLKNDHRQLESRIGANLALGGLTKKDAMTLARTVWPAVDKKIVDAIYDVSRTDVRQYCKIISRTQMTMQVNKLTEPDEDCVASAAELFIRREGR